MAVNGYLSPLPNLMAGYSHHILHQGNRRGGHVWPAVVEVFDAGGHEKLRVVGETGGLDDAVAAKRVLPGLCQVEHHGDGMGLKLLDDAAHDGVVGSLHGPYRFVDP